MIANETIRQSVPLGREAPRASSTAEGGGAKSLITDQPWERYHLESLFPLKETIREPTEFGFLLRHYWIPAYISAKASRWEVTGMSCWRRWQVSCILALLLTLGGCPRHTETPEQELVPARLAALGKSIPLQINAREHPLQISPRGGFEDCVTDEQLVTALSASLPLWEPPSVPTLFHELRLWTVDAVFPSQLLPEGKERTGHFMAATLLSDSLCKENTVGLGEKDYIIDSPFGLHVVQNGTPDAQYYRGEGHYGQLLMVLAEAGVPSSAPVESCTGEIKTAPILSQTLAKCLVAMTPLSVRAGVAEFQTHNSTLLVRRERQ